MFTTKGGVDIEEVAESDPDALARLHIDPLVGFQPFQARWLIFTAGLEDPDEQKQVARDRREALRRVRRHRRDAL